MKIVTTKTIHRYIGSISLVTLRHFILNESISEEQTILLHPHTFDGLALEYSATYGVGITNPFVFLGITVTADESGRALLDRVMVVNKSVEQTDSQFVRTRIIDMVDPSAEIIYRCGYCGSIVDESGRVLEGEIRHQKIALYEAYDNLQIIQGKCCPNGAERE